MILPSTTPDKEHHMGKRQKPNQTSQKKSQEVSPPAGYPKKATNRRENMINTSHKQHKQSTKEAPPRPVSKKHPTGGPKLVSGRHPSSDVDQDT